MHKNRSHLLFIAPLILLLLLLVYYPMGRGVGFAFRKYNLFDLSDTGFAGLSNFAAVMKDPFVDFGRIVLNTVVWISASLILQFSLGFLLASLLKKPFPGRGVYTALVFYTWALSGFAIGLVWAWLFNGQFGLINHILISLGVVDSPVAFLASPNMAMVAVIVANVWYGIPFFGIMLLAALQSVPIDLYESAQIDGAGAFRRLMNITVPYIAPTIMAATLLRTMWIMNFPDIIYAMTGGGPAHGTNILATQMITVVFKQYDYGKGAAIGMIITTILFLYAVFWILRGSSRKMDF